MVLLPLIASSIEPTSSISPTRHLADRLTKHLSTRSHHQACLVAFALKADTPTSVASSSVPTLGNDSSISRPSSSSSLPFNPHTSLMGEALVDPCVDFEDPSILSAPIFEYWHYPGTVLILAYKRSDLTRSKPISVSFRDQGFDWNWDILPDLTVSLAYKVWPPFRLTALESFALIHLISLAIGLVLCLLSYIIIE